MLSLVSFALCLVPLVSFGEKFPKQIEWFSIKVLHSGDEMRFGPVVHLQNMLTCPRHAQSWAAFGRTLKTLVAFRCKTIKKITSIVHPKVPEIAAYNFNKSNFNKSLLSRKA